MRMRGPLTSGKPETWNRAFPGLKSGLLVSMASNELQALIYTAAHTFVESNAGRIWTTMPGQGWGLAGAALDSKHVGTPIAGEAQTPIRQAASVSGG